MNAESLAVIKYFSTRPATEARHDRDFAVLMRLQTSRPLPIRFTYPPIIDTAEFRLAARRGAHGDMSIVRDFTVESSWKIQASSLSAAVTEFKTRLQGYFKGVDSCQTYLNPVVGCANLDIQMYVITFVSFVSTYDLIAWLA